MAEEVKLLGTRGSPSSHRVELALKLKGIQYRYVEEDLSNKSPLLLNSNPVYKKVPVLIHNGKPVSESLVILEYVEQTWKNNPILPQHPYDRAVARFWAKFVDDKILPTAKEFIAENEEEKKNQTEEELGEHIKVLENELQDKEYFGGESIGFVDIATFYIIYWFQILLEVLQIDFMTREKFPVICKYMERLQEIDVVKECLPPRHEHVLAYIRAGFGSAKSK